MLNLSVTTNGLGWKWVTNKPPSFRQFRQRPTPILVDYVSDLLSRKVVKKVKSIRFQGRLFHVPKRDSDKLRVILDLSRLNKFIQCDKFRMLTISEVRTLLPRGAVTTSIDFTDAFYHVPIARHPSSFLGFKLGRQAYCFRAMPFGLNIAPRAFTKLADVVVQALRDQGISVAAYLDDWIIWAPSVEECLEATRKVIHFVQKLGFLVNFEKSRLTPASIFEWIGLHWNLTKHTLSLPKSKCKQVAKATRQFLSRPQSTRRAQERVLGSLQFASITDPMLKVRLKDVKRVWRRKANCRL